MSSTDSSNIEQPQIMADENTQTQPQMTEEQKLKYLQFVEIAAVHTVLCLGKLYAFAKERTGPLKPGVETVEGTVKTVVGPVYEKFHDVPIEVLKYVDGKVGESVSELDRRVPAAFKQVVQIAPVAAQSMASEVKRAGIVDTASIFAKSVYSACEPEAKKLYTKYEPKAEKYAVSAWQRLNQLPLFPEVAQVVLPTANYCTEKYNETVKSTAEKGYRVSSYLPLVPTEKIAKVFSSDPALKEPLVSSEI